MLMNPHLMVYPNPHLTFTHHQPQVQPDPRFRGQPLGFGLFVPVQRFGWTEDLVFRGVGVDHIHASAMEDWQVQYSIEDRYVEGHVFVPATPGCVCKLFRSMHVATRNNPSHALVHRENEDCMLVPLRPSTPGEEVTFDYFAGAHDTDEAGTGHHRYQMHVLAMEGRFMAMKDLGDQHPQDAIVIEDTFEFAQRC